ncbi:MAG TPA: LLM class flavin-dependent oxidoreductase, partial [Phycicoccus sp.]|nr:LLM class flavin-dependent oxidoreductase [Phycicoccus sp.]
MKYGFVVPWAREVEFVELARLAEASSWDMVCTWEPVFGQDPWGQLAAAAVSTQTIRLGTLLTPVPARRPWELAAQCGTVDRLSNGRLTLGVGLGAVNANWSSFLPDEGRATRASQLDEGLAVWAGLLGGQPFSYAGAHWRVEPVTELAPPPPVQQPHPPVWCVGALRPGKVRQPSLERAARWQGILPAVAAPQATDSGLTHVSFDNIVTRLRGIREGLGLPWEG